MQCVVIDDSKSRELPVFSGLTQGYIFGPTLYVFFLNDTVDGLNAGFFFCVQMIQKSEHGWIINLYCYICFNLREIPNKGSNIRLFKCLFFCFTSTIVSSY